MKRDIYLENTPLTDALSKWLARLRGQDQLSSGESVKVIESIGRVTAGSMAARLSSPFYHSAAMDGYAVRYAETFGASETSPKKLETGRQAIAVNTGAPLPDGFNAVIMIEDVNILRPSRYSPQGQGNTNRDALSGDYIEITDPVTPWQNVRTIGEDIVVSELILPENHKIRPVDIGAMLTGGHTEVMVRRKPVVVIIPTGTEIVEPGTELKTGNIIEYNSRILAGLVAEWGGEVVRFDIVPDSINELKAKISEACKAGDLIVTIAGASAGSRDFTKAAISGLGEVILHGVNIKPGKPLILGLIRDKPVIGIPGYPVSAYITFQLFAKPVIAGRLGLAIEEPVKLRARLSRQVASVLGVEEFLRVKIGRVGDNFIATPVSRGAGQLMSLVRADGFVRIPEMSEGLGAGSEIDVELIRSQTDIQNTIVCIGSHDNTLDLLANTLKKRYARFSLSSSHVGSMGGLMALKKGEAHIAGTHLLDELSGEYNVPFIKKLLPEKKIVLLNLVHREQGLLALKGNPKKIQGFGDLTRDDVTFINRQQGAGTRLLTDRHLRELGISTQAVKGYDREEFTHMGVASAVLTGVADTGLAILSSALALGLDFIPVARERYDLAIPGEFLETEMVQYLISIIREDREFREAVFNLGGYDTSDMGKVMYEG